MGMLDEYDEAVRKDILGNSEERNPGYIPGVEFTNSPSILGVIGPVKKGEYPLECYTQNEERTRGVKIRR